MAFIAVLALAPAPSAAQALDACALLPKADVDAAFAPRVFDKGTPGHSQPGNAKVHAVSECLYTAPGTSPRDVLTVNVLVLRAPSDAARPTLAMAKAAAVQLKATAVDVAGVGEGAILSDQGTGRFRTFVLTVLHGKRHTLTLSTGGSGVEPTKAQALLVSLAKRALPRL